MAGLSFKFSKTSEKKILSDSSLRDVSTKDTEEGPDYVKDVKNNTIIGTLKPKDDNLPLVIPLIQQNNWRSSKNTTANSDSKGSKNGSNDVVKNGKEDSLMDEAAKEILEEAAKQLNDWEGRSDGKSSNPIPAIISNAVPDTVENEDHLDVSLRAEASTLDDYENVPIEQYGLAMLRGMGWKPGDGIGGFKKQVVEIFDPQSRPKGLGLGAKRPGNSETSAKEGDEKLLLKRGAYVLIEGGSKRGLYGEVEGLDEENGRVVIKLGVSKEVISVSENIIKLVTKSEFKERGKVLNLDKYEKYKEKDRLKKEEEDKYEQEKTTEKRRLKDSDEYYSGSVKKAKNGDRDYSPEIVRVKKAKTWVRPLLRVRCIDSKLKGGKYYNIKMEVLDVVTNDSCDCRTDEGKIVENVRTDKVETLIPKRDGGKLMIVKGERKGEIGHIIDRDKSRYLATVKLFQTDDVLSLDYDSVCEYLGEVPDYD